MVAGAERAAQVRRRNLPRLAFGRVLELRIVLDRALAACGAGRKQVSRPPSVSAR